MRCEGETKMTPVEHRVALRGTDCTLRDGQSGTLDHWFTSKSTDPWIGEVTVTETRAGQGIFFHGEKTDTFTVNPIIATDYVFGIILRKSTQPPIPRSVDFRAGERHSFGDGACVEVAALWTLCTRQERGSFSVPFKVGP